MWPPLPVKEWIASCTDSRLSTVALFLEATKASLEKTSKLVYVVKRLYRRDAREARLLLKMGRIRLFWLTALASLEVG